MPNPKDLERRLTLSSVVAISISSMLGSGIFVLPGMAILETGPSVWLAYFLAALSVLPAAMSKSELATAMPTSGGTYVYLERTFGPLAGTLSGIGLWLSLLLKSSFALIGIGAYLTVLTNFDPKTVSLVLLTLIILVNIFGVGKVGASILAVVILSLGALATIGIISVPQMNPQLLTPMFPKGFEGLMAATGLVFVSYAGVTKVAAIAEEVQKPEKNLPLGILLSLFIVTIAYCGLTFILVSILPGSQLANDLKPIHSLAIATGGTYFGYGIALIAILTMASMANSGVLAASRFPFAMARDQLLPTWLGGINKRFLTPHIAILSSGIFAMISILFLDVGKIAKLASAFILTIYIVENIAVIVLRETRVQWYNPSFKSPIYPVLQIFGIISGTSLLIGMGQVVPVALLSVALPGVTLYVFYSRHRTKRRGVVGVRVRRKELEEPSPTMASDKDAEVIVTLFGVERSPEVLVELGEILAHGATVEVIHLTEVPEQSDVHDVDDLESGEVRSLKRRVGTLAQRTGATIDFDHIPSHDIYKLIHQVSSRLHCHWLIKEWGGRTHGTFTLHKQMGWLEDHLDCHVINYRDAGIRYISKVMLILPTDDSDAFFIETAHTIARRLGAKLWLMGFCYKDDKNEIKSERMSYLESLRQNILPDAPIELLEGENFVSSVIQASVDFDLIIMRSKSRPSMRERLFGSNHDKIIEKSMCSVVCINKKSPSREAGT